MGFFSRIKKLWGKGDDTPSSETLRPTPSATEEGTTPPPDVHLAQDSQELRQRSAASRHQESTSPKAPEAP